MKHFPALIVLALCAPLLAVGAQKRAANAFDLQRPEIREFAHGAAERTGYTQQQILDLLRQARSQRSILDAMDRPAERTLAWWEYRDRLLTEQRIDEGVAFYRTHRAELDRTATERGVPAEYIVAVLGVETRYGRNTGRYRVLDALATLSFDFPARAPFFRKELEQFLQLANEGYLDALGATGSYAGAMGAPQFMPSSFRNFAVDAHGGERPDLWTDWPDVFASVANYFVANGWRTGEPVLANATGGNGVDDPGKFKLELADSVATIRSRSYGFSTTQGDDAPAVLVPAELQDSVAWRVGFQNFYVITRYNRSIRYAMAVHDLAVSIAERVDLTAIATAAK